jgi:hypothetical protein
VGGDGIALSVRSAAEAVQDVRGEQHVSVVWTGPPATRCPCEPLVRCWRRSSRRRRRA